MVKAQVLTKLVKPRRSDARVWSLCVCDAGSSAASAPSIGTPSSNVRILHSRPRSAGHRRIQCNIQLGFAANIQQNTPPISQDQHQSLRTKQSNTPVLILEHSYWGVPCLHSTLILLFSSPLPYLLINTLWSITIDSIQKINRWAMTF